MKILVLIIFFGYSYCYAQECNDYILKFDDFNNKGDFINAILVGQLVVDSCDGIKNSDSYENILIKLGLAYKKNKNYLKAEYNYLEALEILKNRGSENSLDYAFLLDNMGNLYTASKEYKKAKKCYFKSNVLIAALLGKNKIINYSYLLDNYTICLTHNWVSLLEINNSPKNYDTDYFFYNIMKSPHSDFKTNMVC